MKRTKLAAEGVSGVADGVTGGGTPGWWETEGGIAKTFLDHPVKAYGNALEV